MKKKKSPIYDAIVKREEGEEGILELNLLNWWMTGRWNQKRTKVTTKIKLQVYLGLHFAVVFCSYFQLDIQPSQASTLLKLTYMCLSSTSFCK